MTQFGTAFVSIEPDFSAFDRITTRKLAGSLSGAGEQGGRNFGDGFTKTFEQRSKAIGKPLDKAVADFNTKLRTKIETPKILTPKLPDVDLSQSARLDLQIAGAEAQAEKLRTKIAELTARPSSVKITTDIADAVTDLNRVEAKVAKLSAQRAEVKVDVDESSVGAFNRIGTAATGLLASLGGGGDGGDIGNAAARVSAGFVSFGATAGPLIAIMAALAATIGVALVGALAALASSAALAVAGLAALGAAAGGILGASLGLLIPVVIRMSKVFESLKADNAAADQAAQGAAAGAKAAAAAARAQETAARGLTEANRQLGVASKQAYREMADAAEAASDAVRSVAQAQLSREQAGLNTDKAVADLAELRAELGATGDAFNATFDKFTDVSVDTSGLRAALSNANASSGGTVDNAGEIKLRQAILDVRQARLSEKDAIDGVSDALTTAQRAQQRHNEFVEQGRKASEGYRSALRGVESATIAVAAANEQAQAAQDIGATNAAQEKANLLASRLTKTEIKLKDTIGKVGKALRGAFTPATDAVITGLTLGLSRIPKLVNPLRGSIGRLGESWQKAIETFSADLIRPDSIAKFKAFTEAAARLAGPITRGLSALLDILTDIAVAALPFLERGTKRVADQLKTWSKGTANAAKLDKVIGGLVGHLKTWLGVGAAVADVFLAFFVGAAPAGQGLAETIKSLAETTATWLRSDEGRKQFQQFFKDVIPLALQVVEVMARLTLLTIRFGQTAASVLAPIVNFFGGVQGTFDALTAAIPRPFARIGDLVSALTGHAEGIRNVIFTVVGGIPLRVLSTVPKLRDAGKRLLDAITQGISSVAAQLYAKVGEVLSGALAKARSFASSAVSVGRSIGRGIRDGLVAGLGALEGVGKVVLTSLVGVLNRAIGLLNTPITFANKLSPGSKLDIPTIPAIVLKFGRGGPVPGFGNRDTVPAWLTPGEHVTKQAIVKRFGPTVFADINEGRLDPTVGYGDGERPSISTRPVRGNRYALGGVVGRTAVAERPNITNNIDAHITTPGGGAPDERALAVRLAREVESRINAPHQD